MVSFDPINFGAGAAAGVLTTLAVQRINRFIRERTENREQAIVRTYASRVADEGYLHALVEHARTAHLFGTKVRLDEILVQPRFIPPPEIIDLPDDEGPIENIFQFIPRVHEFPHLHSVYNIPTLSIADLSRGARRIVMVGNQGSGRTTALLTIALWSSGFIEFEVERDNILKELEDALDPKKDVPIPEQILRIRRRVAMAKLSEERAAESGDKDDSRPKDPTEKDAEVLIEAPSVFRQIAPVYVNLGDVILDSGEYGRQIDPSEPLIRALQEQAGWLSSKRLVNKTYKLLESGSALILIDGYDDITADRQADALRWIRALMELYPDNFFIVAMPVEGYGLLMESGAVPVYLRPWHMQDISDSMDKIRLTWENLSKRAIQYRADIYEDAAEYTETLKHDSRLLLPLESTLRTWSIYGELDEDASYTDHMQAYLEYLFPKAPELMPELQRLATFQLDNGYIKVDDLVEFAMVKAQTGENPRLTKTVETVGVTGKTDPLTPVDTGAEAALDIFAGEATGDEVNVSAGDEATGDEANISAGDDADSKDKKEQSKEEKEEDKLRRQIANEQGKLLERLSKAGVIVSYRGGRYQFRHIALASYLAALDLVEVREEVVYRKYLKPEWSYAMNYLAGLRDVDFLVAEQLAQPLDVGLENVLRLTHWLKYANEDAGWRNNLLRYLGNAFATNNQYTVVRERIVAALVGARFDGAKVVFRRGLQTQNMDVRRLCCLALGAISDAGAVDALAKVVLQDQSLENKIVAEMALIAVGTEDALIAGLDVMDAPGYEEVRRAVTESLAIDRKTGYPTLKDMVEGESIALRRAALFGLMRVAAEWSWIFIDRIFQKDTESFVRLASEVVLLQKFNSYFYKLQPYPEPIMTPWFKAWEYDLRETGSVPYDIEAKDILELIFTENEDPAIRWLMTGTIAQTGSYDRLGEVYKALEDREDMVRDRAYRTLVEIQRLLGKRIPLATA